MLKPGDRVNLIRRLAKRLSEEEHWDDIDLILRQFELLWSREWEGTRYSYCLAMLEKGSDDALLNLHEFFFSEVPAVGEPPLTTEGPWEPNRFRLFMCHVATDKVLLADVKKHLSEYAIDGFLAHQDIEPTKEWVREIELALETCDALAVFLTPQFHASYWTDQEIGYCVKRKVLIVPVRMGCDPYGFISRYQAVNTSPGSASRIARSLFDVLVSHDLTRDRMAEVLVTQLEYSESFALAKQNMGLVESITAWSPQLLRRLEASIGEKSQVQDAWGVPERIRAIVQQHST